MPGTDAGIFNTKFELILKALGETGNYPQYVSELDDGRGTPIITGVYIDRQFLPDELPKRLVVSFERSRTDN